MATAASALRVTPFHERTAALNEGAAWKRWSGYLSAISYELTHDREYAAFRNTAGLLDVTPLRKYLISGRDAERLLDRIVTRDVSRCAVGQVYYTPWCDERGQVLDDGTVARLGPELFRMTSAEPGFRWLQRNAVGFEVELADVTHELAALALQGPKSRDILLAAVAGCDVAALPFFRIVPAVIAGARVEISRTGYTGDLGYEIWLDNADALRVWDALLAAGAPHGIVPAGLAALDVARIEAGFILPGVDYTSAYSALVAAQTSSPFELGLGWAVSAAKRASYVGRRALEAERARGAAWAFVGVAVEWDSLDSLYGRFGLRPALPLTAWRASTPLYARGRQVGYCTSGCWSPLLKKYIAIGQVRAAHAAEGTALELEVTVEHQRERAAVRVVPRPFFDPGRKRA
jgi:aminomethyltransferase